MRKRLKMLISMLLVLAMTIPQGMYPVVAAETPLEAPVIIRTWCISDVAIGTDEQVMTVSGSAISLGGNSSLEDGIILITPEDGDVLQSIQTEREGLAYVTVSTFQMEFDAYQRLPEDIKSTIDSNLDGYIVYISKSDYMNRNGKFDIAVKITSELGELKNYVVNVKPSSFQKVVTDLVPGDTYNPFDEIDTLRDASMVLPGNLDNWRMESRGWGSDSNVFDISDGTDGNEFGHMIIKDYGSRSLYIQSLADGREWEIFFEISLGEDQPLTEILIEANGDEFSWTPYNPSNGYFSTMYTLRPHESSGILVYDDVELTINTIDGAEILWTESKYNGRSLLEDDTLAFDDIFPLGDQHFITPITVTTRTDSQTIHIKADGNLESDFLDLVINSDGKTYNYKINFAKNSNMSFRMKYMNNFCVPYNQTIDMFEYFFFSEDIAEDKAKLLEGINAGKYIVNIAGAQNLYEDGIFTGKIKYTQPGSRAYIFDANNKLMITSGNLTIYMRNNYILSANDAINLAESLNMKLETDRHEITVTGKSDTYKLNEFILTANDISDSATITARIEDRFNNNSLLGIITIKIVGSNDDIDTVIGDTVDELSEGAILNINIDTVSKSIFNRLTNKNGYMSLLNKNVVWTFDGQNISVNKAKDVDLDVNVGTVLDETAKTEILRIIEEADADSILMGFPDNGELPGPASMKITLSAEQVNSLKNNNGIYLYYFNKETNQLEKEDADIKVELDYSGNYYVQFTVKHNSDFVLSTDNSLGPVVTPPEEPVDPTPEEPVDPTPEEPVDPTPEEPVDPTPEEPVDPTPEEPVDPTPGVPSYPVPSVPVVSPSPVPEQEKTEDTVKLITAEGTLNASITAVESEEEVAVSLVLSDDILEGRGDSNKDEVVIPVSTKEISKFIAKSKAVDVRITITAPKKLLSEDRRAIINLDTVLLETIKAEEKDLTIAVKDEGGRSLYEWSIAGSDLTRSDKEIQDINLSLTTDYVSNREEISKLADQMNLGLVIDFNHKGALPVQAKVKVYVGDIIGKESTSGIEANKKLYIYSYNSSTGKLETLPYSSSYKVNKDGYLELKLLHGSEYVILSKEADSKVYTSLRNQISVDVRNQTLAAKNTSKIEVKLPDTLEIVDNIKEKPSQSSMGAVTVSYTSNNEAVAKVDENGKISAKKEGKATITTKIRLYSGKIKAFKTKIIVK